MVNHHTFKGAHGVTLADIFEFQSLWILKQYVWIVFTQGSLMYTGTLCGKINSFSLQNQKVKKIGIQVFLKNCERFFLLPPWSKTYIVKGQRAWVTHTVGIRQWMMTPKANSHNINICGKWKYFINNTVIDLLQSGWHGFAAADIQGSTVAFWYRSWSTNKPCHSGGCLLYSSCRNESWLGLNLHDSWLSATRGEQENVYWTWL